jgi:hypothetical protein
MLKVHQRKGEGKGSGLSAELSVNKHWKGRKAESRWVISHSLKQGREWITELVRVRMLGYKC